MATKVDRATRKTGLRTRRSKAWREFGELFKLAIAQLLEDPKARVFGAIETMEKLDGLKGVDGVFRVDDSGTGLFRLEVCIFPLLNEGGRFLAREIIIMIPEATALPKGHPFREDALGKMHEFSPIYTATEVRKF